MNLIKTNFAQMRNFLTLWLGQSVSSLGTAMTGFAISIWAFERTGSALVLSVSALLVMLPRMLMGVLVSPFVDRNNKKRIMICADIGTGICTLVLFLLLRFNALDIGHIFVINFVTSVLGSFQTLASNVAVSVITPKKQYLRAAGLQSFSSGAVEVLAPALAAVLLGFVGIMGVIAVDLITMAFACLSLVFLVKIPAIRSEDKNNKPKFNARNYIGDLRSGFRAVRASALLFKLMLYMATLNFITSMAAYGLLAPMVLARSGNNELAFAVVSSAVGLGGMAGALLILVAPTRTKRIRMIFLCYFLSVVFGDMLFSLGSNLTFWAVTGFTGAIFVPAITANATYFWRIIIPIELQGRAFSVRYAIQSAAIPMGVLTGGLLADFIFEPFMAQPPQLLGRIFGSGSGAGMALMFFLSGLICAVLCVVFMLNRSMQEAESGTEIK
jgi:MFS family permease